MNVPKPKLYWLTMVGNQVNRAIYRGHAKALTTDEIYEGLEQGNLLHKLQEKLGYPAIDLSIFQPDCPASAPTHAALYEASQGFGGKGEYTGDLHFLLDCVFEALQAENWDNTPIRGPHLPD